MKNNLQTCQIITIKSSVNLRILCNDSINAAAKMVKIKVNIGLFSHLFIYQFFRLISLSNSLFILLAAISNKILHQKS